MSFAGYCTKQHNKSECPDCQLDSNLSKEGITSTVLRKINAKLNFLYSRAYPSAQKTIMQGTNLATFRLRIILMSFTFKKHFENQTSKISKHIYSLSLTFTYEISIFPQIQESLNQVILVFSNRLIVFVRFPIYP